MKISENQSYQPNQCPIRLVHGHFNLSVFRFIATALTCPHTKPFLDPLLWAAHQLGVLPEQCVMIGDTTVDILAGQRAGMQTIGVLCGFGEQKELADLKPTVLLATTALVQKEMMNDE